MTGQWRRMAAGDWVRTTRQIPADPIHALLGDRGLPAGAHGVVLDRSGRWVQVEFGNGYAARTLRVPVSAVQITRPGGGLTRDHAHARTWTIVRVSLLVFLAWPFLSFTARYLWTERTTAGLLDTLVIASIDSALVFVLEAVHQPGKALLYIGLCTILTRIVVGPTHQLRHGTGHSLTHRILRTPFTGTRGAVVALIIAITLTVGLSGSNTLQLLLPLIILLSIYRLILTRPRRQT